MSDISEDLEEHIQIFLAGDSTVANCPIYESPMAGWGQMLPSYFTEKAKVLNHAMGGRSSNSFIEEGRLEEILKDINPDDYLLIQFGHNDQKSFGTKPFTTYVFYLTQYITKAREKGAIPVLITSVHRRNFDHNGELVNTLGDYPTAMMELATKLDVPLIDLWGKSRILYEKLGEEQSKQLFVWFSPNQHPNYLSGIQDNTHFCEEGAKKIAELVIEGMKELNLSLCKYLTI